MAKVLGVIPFTFCYTELRKYLFNDCQALRLLSASKLIHNKNILMDTCSVYMGIGSEVASKEHHDFLEATIEDSCFEEVVILKWKLLVDSRKGFVRFLERGS